MAIEVVLLYLLIWSPLLLTVAVAIFFDNQNKGNEEIEMYESESRAKPLGLKDYVISDNNAADRVWDCVEPSDVERMYGSVNIGDKTGDIAAIVKAREKGGFPESEELNTKHRWRSYKPRKIPQNIIEECIRWVMGELHSGRGYRLVRYRITHANITEKEDYLLRFEVIVHKEDHLHAKVIRFDAFCDKTAKCAFGNSSVIGVVHEQNISLFSSSSATSSQFGASLR